ncbi:MAG: DUF2339 domain-containing protein [Rhizobiaceae bacterium]|nr:DUF2339 domain-containing protein [Rhizobiaceae bacterium]
MFESFFGPVVVVALVAALIWMNARLNRMEREHKALLSFFLSSGTVGSQPALQTGDTASGSKSPEEGARASNTPPLSPDDSSLLDPDEADEATPVPESVEPSEAAESAPIPAVAQGVATEGIATPSGERSTNIETALGTRWAVWVGGLALALGGVFLVRYSIEAGLFGPAARLSMASLFGLLLLVAGEFIRRTGLKLPVEGAAGAYVPAILTAAGSFTLFAVIYAAHGIYGFIGPVSAFAMLGIVSVATMIAALLHGQALAGIGLLGSLATPLLVSSDAPNEWALFGYLAIVLVATTAVARLRLWDFLATAGISGIGIWSLIYLSARSNVLDFSIVAFICLTVLVSVSVIWPGGSRRETSGRGAVLDWPSVASALFLGLIVLVLCTDPDIPRVGAVTYGGFILAAMLIVACWRDRTLPLVFGTGVAIVMICVRPVLSGDVTFDVFGEMVTLHGLPFEEPVGRLRLVAGLLGALFLVSGVWKARQLVIANMDASTIWAAWGAIVPVALAICLWLAFGDLDRDYVYASVALILTIMLVAGAEWVAGAGEPPASGRGAVSALLVGSAASAVAFFHMAFGSGLTTVLIGAAVALPALATRYRGYPVLGWLSVALVLVVLIRVAIDPTIVGETVLGRTPVFNALLPGYGIPALAFAFSAWQLGRTARGRPQLVLEASAALFALLAVAMLVRHAMNDGYVYSFAPTLAEQAIYTLIALGGGAILIAIGRRSPSPVMTYGPIMLGVLSVGLVVAQHFVMLNPVFTNESTGMIAVFNLLFLAYLLPAVGAAALALYARDKRPKWYSAMLGLLAATLAFAYATLSVRRWFHGEFIGLFQGMTQLETYAYSAIWLGLGVIILVLGVLQRSQMLRAASGLLIALAVAKVFLFDMSELEGVLRALSFIGLGAVLIGVGLFYQRLLTKQGEQTKAPDPEPTRQV